MRLRTPKSAKAAENPKGQKPSGSKRQQPAKKVQPMKFKRKAK